MHRLFKLTLCLALLAAGCSKSPHNLLHSQLGKGYDQLENYQFAQADTTFSKQLSANPADPMGLYGKGLVHERRLELYDALDRYMLIIKADPSFAPAWSASARILRQLNETDLAVIYAQGFTKRSEAPADAYIDLAAVFLDDRRFADASRALHAADSLGAGDAWTDVIAARAFALRLNDDSASAAFGRAQKASEFSPRWYQYAADYYEARGISDSAVAMSRKAMDAPDADQGELYAHFLRCLKLRYDTEAAGLLKHITGKAGSDYGAMAATVRYNLTIGNRYAADMIVNKMTRRKDQVYSTYMYEAQVRWSLADLQTTLENLETIARDVKGSSSSPEFIDFMLGNVVLFENEIGEDEKVYRRLQDVSGFRTERLPFRYAQAEVVLRGGSDSLFTQAAQVMETSHSQDPKWLTAVGTLYWGRGKRDSISAERLFTQALEKDPTYQPAIIALIDMFTWRAQFTRAIELFSRYPQFNQNPEMLWRKAYCQIRAGQPDNGTASYLQAMTSFPGNIARHDSIYTYLASRGLTEHAGQIAQRALELNPKDPFAYALAARAATDRGDYQKSVDLADQGLALDENNSAVGAQKARALYLQGRKADAVALFESLMKKFSGNADVLHYFSRCLATDRSELPRAADLARQGQFVEAGGYRATLNLSYVYAQAGAGPEARAEATRIYSSYPYEPEAAYALAVALAKEKNPEAKTFFDRAIALGLAGPLKEKALQPTGTF